MPLIPVLGSGYRHYSSSTNYLRFYNAGGNGYNWSASPNSTTNGYRLNFYSDNVNPTANNNRSNGYTARAVQEFMTD